MRIAIYLTKDLIQDAEKAAVEQHATLSAFVGDAIRLALDRRRRAQSDRKFKITTYGEGGVLPGVDLSNTSALLDIMDDIEND
jgi:hypothetical protein